MQLFYHFPELLENYEIVYLPGPNNPLSPYKKYDTSNDLLPSNRSSIKPEALKRLTNLGLVEKDLDTLIYEFIALYSSIFTDPDEKEDTDGMIRRVKGLEKVAGQTILVICIRKIDRAVVGGLIFEHHHNSVCLLITYIFTKSSEQGKGLGSSLIRTVLPYIVTNLINVKIKAVFLETENPAFTPEYTAILDEPIDSSENIHAKRLAFFRKAGAKRLNILYTQPKLSTELADFGNRVYHLYFLMLPDAVHNKELVADKETIFNFLFNFYNTLEYKGRKTLIKKIYSVDHVNDQSIHERIDIDLYRSYLQIELLDLMHQLDYSANQEKQYILNLMNSLNNQYSFVAKEVKKIKEYTNKFLKGKFSELFIKELTYRLIEKVTGLIDNPKDLEPKMIVEYERYLAENAAYKDYYTLYVYKGTEEYTGITKAEKQYQSKGAMQFYSLSYIRQCLIDLREMYFSTEICSGYSAFIDSIPGD